MVLGGSHSTPAIVSCRRAERSVVPLILEHECPEPVGVFLNRMSDYLFVTARFAAMTTKEAETPYKKAKAQ